MPHPNSPPDANPDFLPNGSRPDAANGPPAAAGGYDRLSQSELRRDFHYRPPPEWKQGAVFVIAAEFVEQRDVDHALSLVQSEASTLSEKDSIRLRTRLDEICLRIWARAGLPESTLVFFHPDTRDFRWYPGAGEA